MKYLVLTIRKSEFDPQVIPAHYGRGTPVGRTGSAQPEAL